MNIAVTYFSRTGNTKKVALAIAEAAGCAAGDIDKFEAQEPVDLLFIGGAIYGGNLEPKLAEFIAGLDPEKIKRAAVFSTSVSEQGFGKATGMIKDGLRNRGIPTEDGEFACKGKFLLMSRKHPDASELDAAKQFAQAVADRCRE